MESVEKAAVFRRRNHGLPGNADEVFFV